MHRRPRKRAAGSSGLVSKGCAPAGRACPLGSSATAVQGSWRKAPERSFSFRNVSLYGMFGVVTSQSPTTSVPAPLRGEPRGLRQFAAAAFPFPFSLIPFPWASAPQIPVYQSPLYYSTILTLAQFPNKWHSETGINPLTRRRRYIIINIDFCKHQAIELTHLHIERRRFHG